MKLSTLLLTATMAVSSVFAAPYQHEKLHSEKRQSGYLAVTGPGGPVYPRLEIRQMYFNRPNQFTLLLLALERWQAMDQNDKRSYYQVSGIHGVPSVDWDGVGNCNNNCNSDGYCPHDSILFPAWHRVYVALFEQIFLSIVNDIANSWTGDGAATIRAAASQMRWPYWDWAAQPKSGYNNFPQIMAMRFVSVTNPQGTRTIVNPLFRYQFADNSDMKYYPFNSNWHYTFRYPNTNDASAQSDNNQVISNFNNIRSSLQDSLYQLFSTCTDYMHFSNDRADSSSTRCSNSLEGIHNTVHNTAGGQQPNVAAGHMTYLSTASFDPVFWLHHTNVDRIFAMWQTINPNSYGGGQIASQPTWTVSQGSWQDSNSPLTPMHKDTSGNFYSTNDVRDWRIFSYTYPEFVNSDGSAQSIRRYVNNLYGPGATATAGSSKRDVEDDLEDLEESFEDDEIVPRSILSDYVDKVESAVQSASPKLAATIQNITTAVSQLANPIQANNGSLFQYVANIQAPRYALNGSYTIYVFNGKPACEDAQKWMSDPALVGPIGVLSMPGMTGHNTTIAQSLPLTRSLQYAIQNKYLTDLSEDLVVPYLKTNLYYRVAGPDGTVPIDSIKGFKVQIYGTTMKPCEDGGLPTYSDFIPLKDALKDTIANLLH